MPSSDITTSKVSNETKEALRKGEARFRAFFDGAAIGIGIVDLEGRLLESNPALQEMLGYSPEELLGMVFTEFTYPDDVAADMGFFREMVSGGRDRYQIERRYMRKDRLVLWGRLVVSLVRDADGKPQFAISMVEDVTERKHLEEQFRQSQKMEAVGLLAGGVAHDFNNLLTAIIGYSDFLLLRLDQSTPLLQYADEIKRAGERAASLTRQLLAFSRKQVLQPKVLDLNAIITDLNKMLRRLIGEDIEMLTVLNPSLGRVRADPSQIEQVIMNLAVNARDALPEGGRLTIETVNVDLDEEYARRNVGVEPGRYVLLTISDTGCGMDKETKSRIFEPFFTTKELGKGTGLGLSTVYGIVKQSGGHISVYSKPGLGTTFKLYLPETEDTVETHLPNRIRTEKPQTPATILIVEDHEAVRRFVRETLQMSGYKLLEASNGIEALQICRRHKGSIHLLVTDVVMPQMSGSELVAQIALLRPGIKTLYMSGYAGDAIIRHGGMGPGTAFLQKPFTLSELAWKVHAALDSTGQE